MIVRVNTLLSLLALVPSFPGGAAPRPSCLPFEPKVVSLMGTLTVREHVFILRLERAICVEPDSSSRPHNDPQGDVREIQLAVVGDSLLPRVRRLVGHRIAVTGELFSAESGHHHTPVLLLLRDLRAS